MAANAVLTSTTGFSSALLFDASRDLAFLAMEDNQFVTRLMNKAKKDLIPHGGKYYAERTVGLKNGYPFQQSVQGTGTRPTARYGVPGVARYECAKTWGVLEFSQEALEMGQLIGPDGQVNIEGFEMQQFLNSFSYHNSLSFMGNDVGLITTAVGAGTGATELIVTDGTALREGMYIDSQAASGYADEITAQQITAISGNTVTLAAVETWTNGSVIVPVDSYSYFMQGLNDLINDNSEIKFGDYIVSLAKTTYANISRATAGNSLWKATVYQPNAGVLTEFDPIHITYCIGESLRRQGVALGGFTVAIADWITVMTIADAYRANTITMDEASNVITVGQGKVYIKHPAVTGGKIELLPYPNYRRYTIDFINENDLELRWTHPPEFVKGDNGSIFHRQLNDFGAATDTSVASYVVNQTLMGIPIKHARLTGVKPSDAVPA